MDRNNFQELAYRRLKVVPEPSEKIKNSIQSNINIFRFMGNILELFVPNFLDSVVKMLGGQSRKTAKPDTSPSSNIDNMKYPNQ